MSGPEWQTPVPLDGDTSTEACVWRALNVAMLENGYDMRALTAREVADDLVTCDQQFEQFEPGDLVGYVENWQEGG